MEQNMRFKMMFSMHSLLIMLLALSISKSLHARQTAAASTVRVSEVEVSLFTPTVDIVGSIYSRHNVSLTAGVSGRLDWVAEPGTFVQQGEIVASIDPSSLTLQQAEQKATIRRAKINQEYLARELARLKELRETNSASVFQYDQTKSEYELAGADLEIAQLRLAQINDQLARTDVKAPFTGVVTERLLEAGGEINRSDVIVQFLDTENLEGRIFVPVKYLPFVRQAKEVNVSGDSHQFSASVKAIIPAADTRSQSFELRVALPVAANQVWAAGQLIQATLPVQVTQETMTVHRDALILREQGTFVVVIDKDNVAHRKQVEVGKGLADRVSIKSEGLLPGDKVAIRGAERLQDGQKVIISG